MYRGWRILAILAAVISVTVVFIRRRIRRRRNAASSLEAGQMDSPRRRHPDSLQLIHDSSWPIPPPSTPPAAAAATTQSTTRDLGMAMPTVTRNLGVSGTDIFVHRAISHDPFNGVGNGAQNPISPGLPSFVDEPYTWPSPTLVGTPSGGLRGSGTQTGAPRTSPQEAAPSSSGRASI